MNTEDRLVALVRASVDDDLRGLAVSADLAVRVMRARPPRRARRWRVHFMLAAGCAVAVAVISVVPVLFDRPADPQTSPIASQTKTMAPYDPVRLISVGWVPPGLNSGSQAQLLEVTRTADSKAGVRVWQADYVPAGTAGAALQMTVATGQATMSSVRNGTTVSGVGTFRTFSVPVGSAEYRADGTGAVTVIWQPRGGMVISVLSSGLSKADVLRFVRETSVTMP